MTLTASESSSNAGPIFPDMEMCETCRAAPWKPLTLSAAGSRANLFRQRVDGKLKPILGGCGPTSPVWWMSYHPDTSSWRTCQDFRPPLEVPKLSLILPRSAMTSGGTIFLLPPLAHPTLEKGSSLWPTPTGVDSINRGYMRSQGKAFFSLPGAAGAAVIPKELEKERQKRWPTLNEADKIGDKIQPKSLNPAWVEWLMGFPLGWTDLESSETP